VPILTPIDIKLELLEACGVDAVIIVPFTTEFAATPWREFVAGLIDNVGLAHMVVGHDHAFGKNREGNAESLREYGAERGFTFTQVGPFLLEGEAISSTKIRRGLSEGKVEEAAQWLDRPYAVRGTVVRGDGRGRQLGIPTANVRPDSASQLIPGNGVYCVRLRRGKEAQFHNGMANIGVRPTFTDGTVRTLEVNLFDFDDELYHQQVTVEFLRFVRFEQTFPSKEAFLEQLEEDRRTCRENSGGNGGRV
jgi:riboflavin kinase/FMN adenylyltransferase